ncbi:hypothetical protein FVEG_03330 [Fusarium verticillioides 7600]|uniref:Nephrocystin 3-like N-terminal domain-containing protein n=1 Tax=Gibberella moniliformis (strain M3125 / FGSC 7600) TaxID=334819 RepID=W7M0Y9_GIBM7|nr:hypothetical protein FVEG_03330 [Fusarium verticillioides 7600]EWG41174.1 hypothetical protein FVEG_03330 [Fusarium verticillioides 7600]
MSGAEAALLGVGILCNAMQILTFAKDSIHVYRNIRDGRAPDPNLDSYLKNAKASFDEMNQTAAQMGPLSREQQKIVDVGKKVHDCLDELQQQFAKLHVDEGSKTGIRGKISALKKSALAIWRGKELQDAEENLQRYEQLLHGLLLDRLCSQSQAAEIASLESFHHLQVALQTIISQLAQGSTSVSDLILGVSTLVNDRITDEHATTRNVIENRATSAENKICQSMSQSIDQLRQELLDREQDKAFDKQYEQLLSSLRFPEMNGRKNKISDNYPGTFNWMFDRNGERQSNYSSSSEPHQSDTGSGAETSYKPDFDSFPDWLESDSNVFWVSGKPASGKSFLMKYLALSHLTLRHLKVWRSDVQILTHFFWKPGQTLQRNVEGMALSLLHQVLDGRPGLCRRLCEAQSSVRHKRNYPDWSLEELSVALIWALQASSEGFCIFLDGLDEAEELQHLSWPEWTSAEVIHKLLKVNNIKLCASSREEGSFSSFFKDAFRLRIHQLNDRDIRLFVRERLDVDGVVWHERNSLRYEIVKKAEGVFLWAALVVGRLNRAIRQGNATIEMLQERIDQTPSDLTTLYTDMWERIGDDAQLRSIRVTASLYFNLVIAAREVHDRLSLGGPFWNADTARMSSLVIMATAAQDKSMEAVLNAGRLITSGELLAMCSKAENELQWACRGLLQVITTPNTFGSFFIGDKYLLEYNSTKVDFIHRTAFDFIMDTGPGRECLDFCGPSRSQHASRLFAGHLIRARFIHLRYSNRFKPMNIEMLSCSWDIDYDGMLQIAFFMCCDDRLSRKDSVGQDAFLTLDMSQHQAATTDNQLYSFRKTSLNHGLLDALEAWQSSGLFRGHKYYTPLAYSPSSSNSVEIHMMGAITSAIFWKSDSVNWVLGLMSVLEIYPASVFLQAIPAILRAIFIGWFPSGHRASSELLEYILHRLQSIARKEANYQVSVKNSILALHSLYITTCLKLLTSIGFLVDFSGDHLLSQTSKSFHAEDWQHILLLQFQTNHTYTNQADGKDCHYALVAVNIATAHQIFNIASQRLGQDIPRLHIPDNISSRFDVIIVADMYQDSRRKHMTIANRYAPSERFHDRIKQLVWMELRGGLKLEGGKTWPQILECSNSTLSPVDADRADKYVMDILDDCGMDYLLPLVALAGSRNISN